MANIGGQAGLWTGCSAVTIIQGLFYVWLCIGKGKNSFRDKKRRSANAII